MMIQNDWYEVHHDSFHRVMCKESNDYTFIVGQIYDAINKGNCYQVKNEIGEIRIVSIANFEKHFDSVITHLSIPDGTKGITKSNIDGVIRLEFT